MIEIVCATRFSEDDFWHKSATGMSMRRLAADQRMRAHLAFENTHGLPDLYNARIQQQNDQSVLVFMHDDIWIDDFYFFSRVLEALNTFHVVGVAGNRRRVPGQPAWGFPDMNFNRDGPEFLSGAVAHGPNPFGAVTYYGTVPAECELMDGLFLAARKDVLQQNEVYFDPRFDFHFYDLDFCRTARQKGLRLGTWPICLTHQSVGNYRTEPWQKAYETYIDKWQD